MTFELPWIRLLKSLGSWADVREVPGGIEVNFMSPSGKQRTAEVVITPEEWDEMAEVIGAETAESVRARILALEAETPFLVSDMGVELVASSTRELTPDDDMTPEPGGQWVVTDDAGNIRSRFADWSDDEP